MIVQGERRASPGSAGGGGEWVAMEDVEVVGAARARRAPLPVAAGVAAGLSFLSAWAPLLLIAVAVGATWHGAARVAAAGWLLSQGVPVAHLTLAPLAVTIFVVWRLARAGVHASRAFGGHRARAVSRPIGAAIAVAVAHGLLGALVAALTNGPDLAIAPVRAGFTLAGVGGLAAGAGAVLASRAGTRLRARVPMWLLDALRTGVAAALLVVAAGAALAGLALAAHGSAATAVLGSYSAGLAGQAGITIICLAFLPDLAIWGAAFLLGPGFAMGVDTVVSPGQVRLGAVPALPVLAALPAAPLSGIGAVLLGAPLVAGLVAGALLARRRRGTGVRWGRLLGSAALAAPISAALLGLAAWASHGALGDNRLATVGAQGWSVALFAVVIVGAGCLFGAAVTRTLTTRPS